MRNLFRRIFSGLIYILVLIGSILYSEYAYLAVITVLGFFCIYEFLKIIESKTYLAYIILPTLVFLFFQRPESYPIIIVLGITIISSLLLLYQLLYKKDIIFRDERAKFGLTLRYVIFSLSFLALLPFYNKQFTPSLIISIFVLIWANDSFAFLVGKNFGKNKLFESISPKKTQEGFFGGIAFAVIGAVVISYFNEIFSIIHWIIIALIVSLFGTAGDLIESKFKRHAKLKDSGNIMPGHGGILDRLDSLMFAAPFVYLYINFII